MWTKYIKSIVFTRIKTEGTAKLQSQFPNIYFTTSEKISSSAKFPTVYVRKLSGAERARTTETYDLNAVLASFQIDVIDNASDSNSEIVSDVVCSIMKSMGFELVGDLFQNSQSTDEYRCTSRYQRIIADGDSL